MTYIKETRINFVKHSCFKYGYIFFYRHGEKKNGCRTEKTYISVSRNATGVYELLAYWETETRLQQCLYMKVLSTVMI